MKVLAGILLVGCLGLLAWFILPSFFYRHILAEGIDSSYLKIKRTGPSLQTPKELFKENDTEEEDRSSPPWSVLHFGRFQADFPVRDGDYLMFPYIQKEQGTYRVGMIFSDVKKNSKARFLTSLQGMSGKLSLGYDQIFNLPFFKKTIVKKSTQEIWEDVFTLDIRPLGPVLSDFKKALYKLFVLQIRQRFFPEGTEGFSYLKNSHLGLVHVKTSNDSRWYFYALDQKLIYSLVFQEDTDDAMTKRPRISFAKTLRYQTTTPDLAGTILSEHRGLSYEDKHSPVGMIYLYSAWTHNPEERNIFRTMIHFLERGGEQNHVFLEPLYRYAFRFFGTSLSGRKSKLIETLEERLKRESREQKALSSKASEGLEEETFSNDQEKIESYLEESKKTKNPQEDQLIGY